MRLSLQFQLQEQLSIRLNSMDKKYTGIIENTPFSISLSDDEICTFITHFGRFGNISIIDKQSKEIIVNTVGICLNCFYPEVHDRQLARLKSKKLFDLFKDYKYQKKLKYPKGTLKAVYKAVEMDIT